MDALQLLDLPVIKLIAPSTPTSCNTLVHTWADIHLYLYELFTGAQTHF